MRVLYVVIIFCLLAFSTVLSQRLQAAESAPSWQGTQWINLPKDKSSLDVADLRGKVIYLSFFQKW